MFYFSPKSIYLKNVGRDGGIHYFMMASVYVFRRTALWWGFFVAHHVMTIDILYAESVRISF